MCVTDSLILSDPSEMVDDDRGFWKSVTLFAEGGKGIWID